MLLIVKGQVNFTLEQAMKTRKRQWKYDSIVSWTSELKGLGGQSHSTPRPLHPQERDQNPLYRGLVGPQGRSERAR